MDSSCSCTLCWTPFDKGADFTSRCFISRPTVCARISASDLLQQLLALGRLLVQALRQHDGEQLRLLGAQGAADDRRVGARRAGREDVVALRPPRAE